MQENRHFNARALPEPASLHHLKSVSVSVLVLATQGKYFLELDEQLPSLPGLGLVLLGLLLLLLHQPPLLLHHLLPRLVARLGRLGLGRARLRPRGGRTGRAALRLAARGGRGLAPVPRGRGLVGVRTDGAGGQTLEIEKDAGLEITQPIQKKKRTSRPARCIMA